MSVLISQISASADGFNVFGLGDDNKVYKWNGKDETWELFE